MAYSQNVALRLADQLNRFVTLNRHQLAGQVANLEFWLAEVRHAIGVIDGYEARFRRLRAAQQTYVDEHQTEEFWKDEPTLRVRADPPRRVPHAGLQEARRSLTEATYRFLIRCHRDRLISEDQLRAVCRGLDIGVEVTDLG
jgi:hypothetical protein